MAMTPEQVNALRPGDIVEMTDDRYQGFKATGPLVEYNKHGALTLGPLAVREDKDSIVGDYHRTITVTTPAPAELYLNHGRVNPVDGDVARGVNTYGPIWMHQGGKWVNDAGKAVSANNPLPDELILLVDGENATVVPA